MEEAIEALHAAWERLERDVSLLEHRVAQELLRRDGDRALPDPVRLIERLYDLQRAFPALRAHWERTVALKHDLISITQAILFKNREEIQKAIRELEDEGILPERAPNLDERLADPLSQFGASYRQWQAAMTQSNRIWERLDGETPQNGISCSGAGTGTFTVPDLSLVDAATESLPLAMVQAGLVFDAADTGPVTVLNDGNDENDQPDNNSKSSDAFESASHETSAAHKYEPPSMQPEADTPDSWSMDGFVPIAKAAFQRLPLLLRRRVTSLDALNQAYEKLFCALHERGRTALSDAEAVELLGHQASEQLEVLRALAVLRKMREGWILATASSDAFIRHRPHSVQVPFPKPQQDAHNSRPRSLPVPHGAVLNHAHCEFVQDTSAKSDQRSTRPSPGSHTSQRALPQAPQQSERTRGTRRRSSTCRVSRNPLDNVAIM
jgi:hypothetical protein